MVIPFRTKEELLRRKTLEMSLSFIPRDFRSPMVEMFLKSIIRRPEIMLKPATTVISTSMNSTLKSIRFSQSKSWG